MRSLFALTSSRILSLLETLEVLVVAADDSAVTDVAAEGGSDGRGVYQQSESTRGKEMV